MSPVAMASTALRGVPRPATRFALFADRDASKGLLCNAILMCYLLVVFVVGAASAVTVDAP